MHTAPKSRVRIQLDFMMSSLVRSTAGSNVFHTFTFYQAQEAEKCDVIGFLCKCLFFMPKIWLLPLHRRFIANFSEIVHFAKIRHHQHANCDTFGMYSPGKIECKNIKKVPEKGQKTRLKTFQSLSTSRTEFWLHFDGILTVFRLFRLYFDCILTDILLHFGCILTEFWLHFDCILSAF